MRTFFRKTSARRSERWWRSWRLLRICEWDNIDGESADGVRLNDFVALPGTMNGNSGNDGGAEDDGEDGEEEEDEEE